MKVVKINQHTPNEIPVKISQLENDNNYLVEEVDPTVPMSGNGPISYVSGFSPSIFQTIMTGKTGYDLIMEKLNSERYAVIG